MNEYSVIMEMIMRIIIVIITHSLIQGYCTSAREKLIGYLKFQLSYRINVGVADFHMSLSM